MSEGFEAGVAKRGQDDSFLFGLVMVVFAADAKLTRGKVYPGRTQGEDARWEEDAIAIVPKSRKLTYLEVLLAQLAALVPLVGHRWFAFPIAKLRQLQKGGAKPVRVSWGSRENRRKREERRHRVMPGAVGGKRPTFLHDDNPVCVLRIKTERG